MKCSISAGSTTNVRIHSRDKIKSWDAEGLKTALQRYINSRNKQAEEREKSSGITWVLYKIHSTVFSTLADRKTDISKLICLIESGNEAKLYHEMRRLIDIYPPKKYGAEILSNGELGDILDDYLSPLHYHLLDIKRGVEMKENPQTNSSAADCTP